jgi:hypothetical protein
LAFWSSISEAFVPHVFDVEFLAGVAAALHGAGATPELPGLKYPKLL